MNHGGQDKGRKTAADNQISAIGTKARFAGIFHDGIPQLQPISAEAVLR